MPQSRQTIREALKNSSTAVSAVDGETDVVPSRRQRSKLQTRARLIDAGRRVMSEKGVDSTTIAEIAKVADIGFGTFYNYFDSKEALAKAVLHEVLEEFGKMSDAIFQSRKDPAEGICLIQKAMLDRATRDPVWGWFVVRSNDMPQAMEHSFGIYAGRHLEMGVKRGRFQLGSVRTAEMMTRSSLLTMVKMLLNEQADSQAVACFLEMMLRMYGIPVDEARSIAHRPLPAEIRAMYS